MKALPPPLPAPKRSLTPPARRSLSESGAFSLESPTPARSKDMVTYQALLSVFDELTDQQRVDFVEFGFVFKSLPDEARKRLLEQAVAELFP